MPGKQSASNLPKNWPAHLPYLRNPSYSPNLSPEQHANLRTKPPDALSLPPNTPKGPCALVKIAPITDPAHPAHGQAGLFAARDLKPGAFIIQYLGVVHSSSASTDPPPPAAAAASTDPHAASDYDLALSRPHALAVDAARAGNEARFLNDYRGVAPRPNAEFGEAWDHARGEMAMAVWVLPAGKGGLPNGGGAGRRDRERERGIRRGQEILVSYGKGFWAARKGEKEVEVEAV